MSDPILDLFKTQLEKELDHLAQKRNYLNAVSQTPDPGVAFPHWYFERVEQMDKVEADEIILDGFGDEKIDAIHISEDDTTVRFFQFKNCKKKNGGIDDSAIDGIINSLNIYLIGNKQSRQLSDQFKLIKSKIRASYKILIITSGAGLTKAQRERLEKSLEQWDTTRNAFSFEEITLSGLSNLLYTRNLPTVNSTVQLRLDTPPYQTRIGDHNSLVCDIDANVIAEEYERFGEKLLQQNIRNSEGDSLPNRAIYKSATSETESQNFYFFNNGITIICDKWEYDQPSWFLKIERPQVVNGGQTLRQLNQARKDKKLRPDVKVLLRVISVQSDREFAGNFAVNLNNQTIVRSSFLKSNHPFFIQMQQSLLSSGWYLERKAGDWESLNNNERDALILKIGDESKIIQIQTGCQSYCAAYLQDIELSKRNPKNMFTSKSLGGKFEDLITHEFTAAKLIDSYRLLTLVSTATNQIKNLKRSQDPDSELTKILKTRRKGIVYSNFRKMLPQANLFLCGLVAYLADFNLSQIKTAKDLEPLIRESLLTTYFQGITTEAAWGTQLRSQVFFDSVKKSLKSRQLKK